MAKYKLISAMPNITLRVNKEMAEHIKTLRQTDRGRAIVLNSIYLPTVMYTLDQIWAEPLAFSESLVSLLTIDAR